MISLLFWKKVKEQGQANKKKIRCFPAVTFLGSFTADLSSPRFMGCFQDSAARDLPTEIDVRPLTVEGCVFKCGRLGFSMAGVQSSSLCFCGTTYSRYGRLRNEQCNMRCTGNYKEICGGFLRSSLYYTGKTKCPNKCKIKQLTRDKFRILATDVL